MPAPPPQCPQCSPQAAASQQDAKFQQLGVNLLTSTIAVTCCPRGVKLSCPKGAVSHNNINCIHRQNMNIPFFPNAFNAEILLNWLGLCPF